MPFPLLLSYCMTFCLTLFFSWLIFPLFFFSKQIADLFYQRPWIKIDASFFVFLSRLEYKEDVSKSGKCSTIPPFSQLFVLFFFFNPSLITRVSLIEWNIGTKRHGNNAFSCYSCFVYAVPGLSLPLYSKNWLLLALNRLVSHFNQPILGLAVREVGNGSNRLLGVVVGESSGLLNTVALKDQLASL